MDKICYLFERKKKNEPCLDFKVQTKKKRGKRKGK